MFIYIYNGSLIFSLSLGCILSIFSRAILGMFPSILELVHHYISLSNIITTGTSCSYFTVIASIVLNKMFDFLLAIASSSANKALCSVWL